MNIGEAADRSGLPVKTLRYYEGIGLVVPSGRKTNRYRIYSERDIQLLRFVCRARSLGFKVEACRELLELYRDRTRNSADVRSAILPVFTVRSGDGQVVTSVHPRLPMQLDQPRPQTIDRMLDHYLPLLEGKVHRNPEQFSYPISRSDGDLLVQPRCASLGRS